MGFFDGAIGALQSAAKNNYKSVTGRDYDIDVRNYMREFEYEPDYKLQSMWNELCDNNAVRLAAKKWALRQTMLERNLDID